jgi:pimeloyl-ACP methyl ester carboxylesterase
VATLVLVHGGLWEDIDAERFWVRPGVVDGLRAAGFAVAAPDRAPRATSWEAEAEHLAGLLPAGPLTIVAGSNGCSAAVALALSRPVLVERLLLAWPVRAGDPKLDAWQAKELAEQGADQDTIDRLLTGDTLRGFTDDQLRAIPVPVGLLPPDQDDPFHRRDTVEALLKIVPGWVELGPGTPEPPRPEFPPHLGGFISAVTRFTVGP